jgi:hypothetical protein
MKTKKTEDEDYTKDDEILREEGMCDGPITVGNIELRPVTALSVSYMQRNAVFSDAKDLIWKTSAFAFLHSAPSAEVRKVVNDRDLFSNAVDNWIDKNVRHHAETTEIAEAMNAAFKRYTASASDSVGKRSAAGN